jgi:hypothetical protein
VAWVSFSVAAAVPVAKVMVELAPVVADTTWKPPEIESNETPGALAVIVVEDTVCETETV